MLFSGLFGAGQYLDEEHSRALRPGNTLLDLRLLVVEPGTRLVCLSRRLRGTQYEVFAGRPVADPVPGWQRPARESLDFVWREFCTVEG